MNRKALSKDIDILYLMRSKIHGYNKRSVSISDLIYDLESFLNQLETVDEEWKTDFRTSWLNIEVAFALALDEDRDLLNASEHKIVEESLIELIELVASKLAFMESNK